MISSKSLKNFVRKQEYKLDAKLKQRRAETLDAEAEEVHWGADVLDDRHQQQISRHWHSMKTEAPERRRSDSRYFNFILTATHQ
jgi:hypothetical protein